MKRVVKFIGVVAVGLNIVVNVSAQQKFVQDFGSDGQTCSQNLSLYIENYKTKNFNDAIIYWRKVWKDCPLSSANLTLHGTTMYKHFIDREFDQNRKKALIDTLMQVWEKSIELRPNMSSFQDNYVNDMKRYSSGANNQDMMLSMYKDLMDSQKENTKAHTYVEYMRIIFTQNMEGKVSDEELFDEYNRVNDLINDAIQLTTDEKMGEELANALGTFEDLFVKSTAASCENLEKIYEEKYEDNKNDSEFLRKLTDMLTRKNCTGSELYEKAAEQQFALNPTSSAAHSMAQLFLRRENFEKGVEYLQLAIANETNPYNKARYNYLLGQIMLLKYKRFNEAKRYVKEASKLRPNWGEPYILLADIYNAGPRCGASSFEQNQVFWVIVDLLQRAITVDPDVADKDKVNDRIRQFSAHFPKKDDGFFLDTPVVQGQTITVGCWIGETTRVRLND